MERDVMTALLNRAADKLLRTVVPSAAASACTAYQGACYVVRTQCFGGSNCVEWYQCLTWDLYLYCFVDQPGSASSTYPGCC
jgi:hypothetical protein